MRNIGICLLVVTVALATLLTASGQANAVATGAEPAIVAERAIAINAGTGAILFERNATERAAPASLTKLFTALVAIESSPLQRRMSVAKDDLVGEASAGLQAGENLSFETLLHGLMLASGNDAAMAVARNVGESQSPSELDGVTSFINAANQRIADLGLRDTNLVNPHGLDAGGHYSSARDIAAITMHGLRSEPEFLSAISSPGYIAEGHHFVQNNQLIGNYPGAAGGKTGITDDAGFCLMGIAHRDGRTVITVVLGSTPEAWYSDAMALFDHAFATPAAPGLTASKPGITLADAETIVSPVQRQTTVSQLQIQPAGLDASSVRSASWSSATPWRLWRWPVGATLAILVVFVCAVQARALAELQKRPLARGRRPRVARPQASHAKVARYRSPAETQPFTTIGAWNYARRTSGHTVWSGSAGD